MGGLTIFDKIVFIALLCTVVCFGWSTQDKVTVKVSEAKVQVMREHAKVCEKETGVPAATLKKLVTGPLPGDEPTKTFLHCVCYNSGYTDKDGHTVIETLGKLSLVTGTEDDYINILKECNNITKDNHLDTVYAVYLCVHNACTFEI